MTRGLHKAKTWRVSGVAEIGDTGVFTKVHIKVRSAKGMNYRTAEKKARKMKLPKYSAFNLKNLEITSAKAHTRMRSDFRFEKFIPEHRRRKRRFRGHRRDYRPIGA